MAVFNDLPGNGRDPGRDVGGLCKEIALQAVYAQLQHLFFSSPAVSTPSAMICMLRGWA